MGVCVSTNSLEDLSEFDASSSAEGLVLSPAEKWSSETTRRGTIEQFFNNHPELRSELKQTLNVVDTLANLLHCGVKTKKCLRNADYVLHEFIDIDKTDHVWKVLGNFMADTDAILIIKKVLLEVFKAYPNIVVNLRHTNNATRAATETAQMVIANLTIPLWYLSDQSIPFTVSCAENGLVPVLVNFCFALAAEAGEYEDSDDEEDNDSDNDNDKKMIRDLFYVTLRVVFGIARRAESRVHVGKINSIVATLLDWTSTKGKLGGLVSLLTLSYIVNEAENHLLEAKGNILYFLVNLIRKAIHVPNRRSCGHSPTDLAEGLTQIALNDRNKINLGKHGAIPVLNEMLNTAQNDEERECAVKALYTLSFNEENRKLIKNEEQAMKILRQLSKAESDELRRIAAGTLWEVEGKHERENQEKVAPSSTCGRHVMISYQWDVQNAMIDVKNALQASGYHVWMDIENMKGSTLDTMAKAVENASVVLIGVSQKYKDSPNCRSEAEYAYKLRKKTIPLMMEADYDPDGWLGMILGTKLWMDFRDGEKHSAAIKKLIEQLEMDCNI